MVKSVQIMKVIQLLLLNLHLITCNANHFITKRALMFPRSTFLQFTYGLTVPLVLPRRSINFSICTQNNYNLPYNISHFQPMTIPARHYNSFFGMSRRKFYHYVIQYLDSFGFEGEECLLRTICEIAEVPMHIKNEDTLLEKIVHFVFTPSLEMYGQVFNRTTRDNLGFVDKLLLAENIGKEEGECGEVYSECLISIVDIFSAKYII